MILIVSSREDYTADFVVLQLTKMKIPFIRFNTEDFPSLSESSIRITTGKSPVLDWSLTVRGRRIELNQVSGIWYRRPRRPSLSQFSLGLDDGKWAQSECEALLRSLWETSDGVMVSTPSAIRRAEEKPLQLQIAAEAGMTIPESLISNDPELLKDAIIQGGSWISKPLWSGSYPDQNGDLAIWCEDIDPTLITADPEELRVAPFILQRKVDKAFDSRVVMFGDVGFAFSIRQKGSAELLTDWRAAEPSSLFYEGYPLPSDLQDQCSHVLAKLNLKFGAFDFAVLPNGEHIFLEVNPNGQWAWLEIATGVELSQALIQLLNQNRDV